MAATTVGKSYGGKSGVWLIKKRKRIHCITSTINNNANHSAAISSSSSSTTTTIPSTSSTIETQLKSNETNNFPTSTTTCTSLQLQPKFVISKPYYDRAKLLKLKGSHHGGVIPKKFLLHFDLYYNHNTIYNTANYYHHWWNNNPNQYIQQQKHDQHLNRTQSSSSIHCQLNHQTDFIGQQQSPKVQQIGWDPIKCRPIFYFSIPNNNDNHNFIGHAYNSMSDDTSVITNKNNNHGYYDIMDASTSSSDHDHDNHEEEDPYDMWRESLEERRKNDEAKQSKTNNNRRSTYGKNKGKKYTYKSLSVLERLASPKNQKVMSRPNNCKKYSVTTGRLNKKRCTNSIAGYSKEIPLHQHEKFGVAQLCESSSSCLTTPITEQQLSTNICAALDSGKSNSTGYESPSSRTSNTRMQRCSMQTNQREPLYELQFPDDLDREIVTATSQSVNNNTNNSLNDTPKGKYRVTKLMPRVKKGNVNKIAKISKHCSTNNYNDCNKENIDPIKQISSATSLSDAKAFFENLDKYELTIE